MSIDHLLNHREAPPSPQPSAGQPSSPDEEKEFTPPPVYETLAPSPPNESTHNYILNSRQSLPSPLQQTHDDTPRPDQDASDDSGLSTQHQPYRSIFDYAHNQDHSPHQRQEVPTYKKKETVAVVDKRRRNTESARRYIPTLIFLSFCVCVCVDQESERSMTCSS